MSQLSPPQKSVPKLTYFDVRGRAEVIRLLLEESGTVYTEHRVSLAEWPTLKPTLAFGQLPLYEEEGLVLNQSQAIYRHLARVFNLYGDNEQERTRCDIVQETFVEAQLNIGGFFWNPEFVKLRDNYEAVELPALLARLQKLFDLNTANSGYWVGRRLSFVDFMAWHTLDYVRALSQKTLDEYPKLARFREFISARPRIAAYLASSRRPATLTVAMSSFGGTPETS